MIVLFLVLAFKIQFVSLISLSHNRPLPISYRIALLSTLLYDTV
jgi:hypothetical protein